ncbi:MAG: GNAT family N-acetyltransferase [Chloroflexi bacterium]|jgi:RimJ/RimL family protein N-acetyltransferase|nr:GNAT family N-acetyltransferase [Chloroflexota bacterium]MDP6496288.1 GNAT family N-acetyltransferase [Dehalococcoidia bacterium]MQF90277.1 GNAT family N-acetyltransferase [SAR202 cluster bacterium]MDP7588441.1 GNAT family N-acetyltransferase [Dehalococcoidia bacterium]MQG11421.1 GNAT family N-acetyltransferase [SAR202 cluster bacterium]|tara:strand:- start:2371 stop:3000 length:630 start_codon:yes stop_codon:yes gene_type:complete
MAVQGGDPAAELKGARIVLRDKRFEDAENDYRWRSDPELARLDAAIPLTMSFERYLKLFEDQMKYPTPGSHHYSIETLDGLFIGNCMYYDLDTVNREAELGIVIGDRDYWSDGYGYDAVTTLLEHMFTTRELKRVYLHTLEWNGRAQKSFSKSGFNQVRAVRRMAHDFILMDVLRDDWFETREERLAARFRDSSDTGSQGSPPSQTTAD